MRILIVDDDKDYRGLLSKLLQARGHDVLSAENGKDARELLDVERADLIVSDVFMPTLDGIWFHSYVREFSDVPDIPFVFVTGRNDSSTRHLVADPGIDLLIDKMTTTEDLIGRIERFGNRSSVQASPKSNESPMP